MARSDSLIANHIASIAERRVYRDVAELALVAVAFLLYFIVRANVIDRPEIALVDLEQALGIHVEAAWQEAILGQEALVRFFNFVYFWLDFPLIAALGLWMYFRRRPQYTFTRDAILFSGALALISYNLFPVAPPRLLPEAGLIDTLQIYNPFAAMPSLHVGWAALVALGVTRAVPGSRIVLILAVAHVVAQSTSTVFTGNHYFLDWAGGLVVASGGFAFAVFMQRRGYELFRRKLGLETPR